MNALYTFGLATAATILGTSSAAYAQSQPKDSTQESALSKDLSPATHDVELTIGTGYEQAFGKIQSGQPSLTDVGTAGGAVQIGVGYRLLPRLTLGLYGSGSEFARGSQIDSSATLYSAAAGVQADFHISPAGSELDPWVSLSSGWRGYWISETAGKTSLQGLEIAKLQVGLDYRMTHGIAIAPVVGADLSTFVTESTPASNGFANISHPDVNTFFFAGLLGRFDLPTGSKPVQTASR